MTWRLIAECKDNQKSHYGKITDAINMNMVCRVTWDENQKKIIAHLANGDKIELKSQATSVDNLEKVINLMP